MFLACSALKFFSYPAFGFFKIVSLILCGFLEYLKLCYWGFLNWRVFYSGILITYIAIVFSSLTLVFGFWLIHTLLLGSLKVNISAASLAAALAWARISSGLRLSGIASNLPNLEFTEFQRYMYNTKIYNFTLYMQLHALSLNVIRSIYRTWRLLTPPSPWHVPSPVSPPPQWLPSALTSRPAPPLRALHTSYWPRMAVSASC